MKKYAAFYVKYVIKNKLFFLSFIALFVAVFVIGAMMIRVDVVESYTGELRNGNLYVKELALGAIENQKLYLYKNRNEKVYQAQVELVEQLEDGFCLKLTENFPKEIEGTVGVDIVCGEQSLLKRIFVKAGKVE